MRRFRMVDMCKGKRKLWLRGTNDVLLVVLHMVGKRVKVPSLNNVTSFLTLLFFFFHLIHPSHIFLAAPLFSSSSLSFILSFSYFSLSLLFYIFFSFFLFHTHTFIFIFPSLDNFSKLSTPLFLECIQSEILNKSC
jgi:formate-dependent nitrite reductase membrane component NrfD